VLVLAYLQFFLLERIHPRIPPQFRNIIPLALIVVAYIGMQIFNPALGSPIVGIMGLRNYFIYAPLVLLIPHTFRDIDEFHSFLRFLALTMIPIGILGFAQFFSPSNSPINRYVAETVGVAQFGEGRARITGTF